MRYFKGNKALSEGHHGMGAMYAQVSSKITRNAARKYPARELQSLTWCCFCP